MSKKKKQLVNHGPCPRKDCGSTDAFTEYEDGHGWCFSCGRGTFPKDWKKQPEEFTLSKNRNSFRGIPQSVCELYGIKTYEQEDRIYFRVYQYQGDANKVRRVGDKAIWKRGKDAISGLYGSWLFNAGCSHYITVVEGEEDAAAAYHMLNSGKKTLYPVVALPSSSISNRHRADIYTYLSSFETVKIAIEDDKEGRKAKAILREMLPNKIREVKLTKHKDANDYLVAGDEKEFVTAWNNAKVFTPDNIFHTEEDIEKILKEEDTEKYIETPFVKLNELIKGICLNRVTLLTGMEGIGKTEILRAIEYELIRSGNPCGILHFEETKSTLVRALCCYETYDNYRDLPDIKKVIETFNKITDNYKNFFVFEFKQDPDINAIIEQINYLVHICGVKYIFIDPINQFDPIGTESRVEFLDVLSKKLARYVTVNPVGIIMTAHLNDDGQTRDSRMISKSCSVRIDLKRDVMNEDPEEKDTVHFFVSKNRPFSKTGYAGFAIWDDDAKVILDGGPIETDYKEVVQEKTTPDNVGNLIATTDDDPEDETGDDFF